MALLSGMPPAAGSTRYAELIPDHQVTGHKQDTIPFRQIAVHSSTQLNGRENSPMQACATSSDFSIERDVCNPYNLAFTSASTGFTSIRWDFGDGNNTSGTTTPVHLFPGSGTYLITMITDYSNCSDTVKKSVPVDLPFDNTLITTNDTTICFGSTKQLHAVSGLNFCWSPTTYLQNPNSQNPVTTTPETMTYYYSTITRGNNLIVNGDFSQGNFGFVSQYLYNPTSGVNPGVYNVGSSVTAWHNGMVACPDHTTGSGNMMMVNGAEVLNVKVWTQTINVVPNTNYAFSTWIQNISFINPARLQFSINGVNIGVPFTANEASCVWEQFYTTWNSGSNTSAQISIVNQNQIFSGNDFALDDISFTPVYLKTDSVRITVDTPVVKTIDDPAITCQGTPVQLTTTGAATYSWSPAAGLSNPNTASPVAAPATSTQYIVTGTTANGCVAKDTVMVNVEALPVVSISNDTSICRNTSVQLTAGGGSFYSWTPAASLDNSNIPDPVASPAGNTVYHVTVTSTNGCSTEDSVKVSFVTADDFTVNGDKTDCLNNPVQLLAAGGDIYTWSPAGTLDNPDIANPMASPGTTTTYSVTITESKCNETATLNTTVFVMPLPDVTAGKSNDIDCSFGSSTLSASGAAFYTWSPAATLNNPASATPVATPDVTTDYTVTGTTAEGCVNTATVTVKVDYSAKGLFLMPSAFTPNGDGLNDCYGLKYWGNISELQFSIYNRWGERIFYTTDPGACWDGTYKGKKQNPDVYVFMIKAKSACQPEIFKKGTFALIR